MSERHARLHLLGIAAGLLAGALLGYLLRPAAEIVYQDPVGAQVPAPAPGLEGLGQDALAARAAAAREAGEPGGPAGDEREEGLVLDPWMDYELFDEVELAEPRTPEENRSVRGSLARATLHALAGEIAQATAELRAAMAAGATTDEALGVCSLLSGADWREVVEALRAAHADAYWNRVQLAHCARQSDNGPWGWQVLLDELQSAESVDEDLVAAMVGHDARKAGALFTARLLADPQGLDVEACSVVAYGLKESGASVETAAFLRAMVAAYPFEDSALELLVNIDPVAAEAHALQRLAERPDDVQAWRTLAAVRSARGERAGALEAYRRLAELAPEPGTLKEVIAVDAALGLQLAQRAAEGSTNDEMIGTLASAHIRNGNLDKAFDAYVRAVDLDAEDHEWLGPLVELDPIRAVQVLRERAETAEAGDELVGAYGNALLESGRREEAFAQYERALRQDPSDFEWQFGIARADGGRAVPLLSELLADEPDSAQLSSALGLALMGSGRREEGLQRMEDAARRTPDYTTCSQLCRGDAARGRAVLEHLLRTDPKNDEWHGILGDVHARAGERELALAAYERAQALDPSDDYWPRRMALLRAGR